MSGRKGSGSVSLGKGDEEDPTVTELGTWQAVSTRADSSKRTSCSLNPFIENARYALMSRIRFQVGSPTLPGVLSWGF